MSKKDSSTISMEENIRSICKNGLNLSSLRSSINISVPSKTQLLSSHDDENCLKINQMFFVKLKTVWVGGLKGTFDLFRGFVLDLSIDRSPGAIELALESAPTSFPDVSV
jgi:hypothetical protein